MSTEGRGDVISGQVTGSTPGQVAIGKGNQQHQALGDAAVTAVTEAERERLRLEFARVREHVAAQAPAEQRGAAVERVEELEQAVFAEQPDITTIQYVTGWFRRNLPSLAGSVTGLVVHPLVGRLVQVAADRLIGGDSEAPGA